MKTKLILLGVGVVAAVSLPSCKNKEQAPEADAKVQTEAPSAEVPPVVVDPAQEKAPSAPADPAPAPTGTALDLIPPTLVNAEGGEVSKDALKGKIVGLYFSAHWCPPCRAFTPQLVAFRDAQAADFEVVFVSSDKNAEAMKGYMTGAKMQWPAVAFGDPAVKALKQHFGIRGIPTLVILGADGKVISKNGRGDVMRLKDGALDAWKTAGTGE